MNGTTRLIPLIRRFVLVCLAAWLVLAASPTARAQQRDMLFLNLLFPREVYQAIEQEYQRVLKLCPIDDHACWIREARPRQWTFNAVREAPTAAATQSGNVVVLATYAAEDGLRLRVDYRPVTGAHSTWLRPADIGDWGYEVWVYVAAEHLSKQDGRRWVRLPADPFPASAWIELDEHGLHGDVESIAGRIVTIQPGVPAVSRQTGRHLSLPADSNYVVEGFEGAAVLLREEVPADMPCAPGSEEKDVTAKTPRYRVRYEDLFSRNGRPLLTHAYPRGC
ncbi:MAG TPA: hypothetical protein VD833_22745 [Vicinamibacterales bacterium]|nr:hypothetical protein [Vicinamibacterales bacterium]